VSVSFSVVHLKMIKYFRHLYQPSGLYNCPTFFLHCLAPPPGNLTLIFLEKV